MASYDALNTRQFYNEQSMLHQGNTDELANHVRGFQNMTSNIYRPSFSADYTTVHSFKSPAHSVGQVETGMDEE
jgi:hypothetical protein